MPIRIIEDSFKYCIKNKLFFCLIVLLLFINNCIITTTNSLLAVIISLILVIGYGLQVTQDIINGGTELPKVMPKKMIIFGVKGIIVFLFYFTIQGIFLAIIAAILHFPELEIEELILRYNETINLFWSHNPLSFVMFIVFEFIIIYSTSFFMELSIAKLADGGSIKNTLNFLKIKHAIDVIGWKDYSWDYTKIILSVVILTFLSQYHISITIVDNIFSTILRLLIFIIQFMGMGYVYKVYKENKLES